MSDVGPKKEALRREMKSLLSSIDSDRLYTGSLMSAASLWNSTLWDECDRLYIFYSLPREIQTSPLMTRAYADGKSCAFPRIENDRLCFYLVPEGYKDWVEGPLSLREPDPSLPLTSPERDARERQRSLVITPGLAFDRRGHRLGRGKGYYDRYLARYGAFCKVAGFCLNEQVVESVPHDTWDFRLDALITEDRVIFPGPERI
jgi:5-formyltetrahydrofolate cyclo-ligase